MEFTEEQVKFILRYEGIKELDKRDKRANISVFLGFNKQEMIAANALHEAGLFRISPAQVIKEERDYYNAWCIRIRAYTEEEKLSLAVTVL